MAFYIHDFIDNDLTFTAPNDSDSNVYIPYVIYLYSIKLDPFYRK